MRLTYEILLFVSGAAVIAAIVLWQFRRLRKAELLRLGHQFASEFKRSLVTIESDFRDTISFMVSLELTCRGSFWHFRVLDLVVISFEHPEPEMAQQLQQYAEGALHRYIGRSGRPKLTVFAVRTAT